LTQERFIKTLDNPDLLSSISYEELKTLALAYPYAHNLRYLLALKGQQDKHPDAPRTLETAAAHSLDRTRLFALVAAPLLTPQRVAEEVLVLKPIETIQRELDALTPVARPEMLESEKPAFATPIPAPAPAPAAPVAPVTPPISTTVPPTALPPLPFTAWINQFSPPALTDKPTLPLAPSPALPPPPAPARSVAQALAERSVAENKDVISETLARLLAKQGYRDKAIVMYERLALSFPEKSSFFAAEIEKLKK